MPSHIFVRLGMWEEAIASNVRAAAAGARAAVEHGGEYTYQIHAMEFLNYAYLQRGLEAKAREQHDGLSAVPGASEAEKLADRALFAGRAAIELHRWQEAATLPVPDLDPSWLSDAYWARTIGAARTGHLHDAHVNLAKYRESLRVLMDGRGPGARVPPSMRIAQLEAEGWVTFAEGQHDRALNTLHQAARLERAEGGESLVVPAREMLADLLLELRRPAAAFREYEEVLRAAPNRFNAVLGAACRDGTRRSHQGAQVLPRSPRLIGTRCRPDGTPRRQSLRRHEMRASASCLDNQAPGPTYATTAVCGAGR
jgi:tetratricopeptide (TPR) repeat protein